MNGTTLKGFQSIFHKSTLIQRVGVDRKGNIVFIRNFKGNYQFLRKSHPSPRVLLPPAAPALICSSTTSVSGTNTFGKETKVKRAYHQQLATYE